MIARTSVSALLLTAAFAMLAWVDAPVPERASSHQAVNANMAEINEGVQLVREESKVHGRVGPDTDSLRFGARTPVVQPPGHAPGRGASPVVQPL